MLTEKIDPHRLYKQSKKDEIEFHNFYEWINYQVKKVTYDRDNRFVEMEQIYIQQQKRK